MPSLSFQIVSGKNEGLVLSPSELKELYFFGVNIQDGSGGEISDLVYKTYIKAAQEEVEKTLNIRLAKQIINETRNFSLDDFRQWGFVRTSYPVNVACNLKGLINEQPQIEYPAEWLVSKRDNKGRYYRQINIVPNQGGNSTNSGIVFSGVTAHIGLRGLHTIPQYWNVSYVTGLDTMPSDVLNVIGKLAAINIFHIAGDLILGAGIASSSIGLDSLSQSISTTSSATNAGYGSRIINYTEDIKKAMPILLAYYKGFTMTSM